MRRILASIATVLFILTATLLAISGIVFALAFVLRGQTAYAAPSAVIGAAGLATLGWLIAAYNQRVLSRKQHTLNLLIQWRHSELYKKHLESVLQASGQGKPLTPEQTALCTGAATPLTQGDKAFVVGANYILNYWEFVCASVIVNDLDAELVRRTIRPHIVGCHLKFVAKIDHDQERSPLTYGHLRRLSLEWQTDDEKSRLELFRKAATTSESGR